jgi:hypothetical protein
MKILFYYVSWAQNIHNEIILALFPKKQILGCYKNWENCAVCSGNQVLSLCLLSFHEYCIQNHADT